MEIIKEIDQRTNEWHELRAKRMTASNAQAIGNAGKGLNTYIYKMMCDYYSKGEKKQISNSDLERGVIREPQAKFLYENETGNIIQDVCFIIKDDFVGCSPDGLIGDDGMFETKAPDDIKYFQMLLDYKKTGDFEIDSSYIWQMQMQMEIAERKWVDFTNYNPNFEIKLLKKRIYADNVYFEKLRNGYKVGTQLIKDITKIYENKTKKTN